MKQYCAVHLGCVSCNQTNDEPFAAYNAIAYTVLSNVYGFVSVSIFMEWFGCFVYIIHDTLWSADERMVQVKWTLIIYVCRYEHELITVTNTGQQCYCHRE